MAEKTNKLYRFPKSGWLGGVCAGISYRLKLQTWIARLLLVLLALFTSGSFVVIYILFWIFMPKAETPEDYKEVSG